MLGSCAFFNSLLSVATVTCYLFYELSMFVLRNLFQDALRSLDINMSSMVLID